MKKRPVRDEPTVLLPSAKAGRPLLPACNGGGVLLGGVPPSWGSRDGQKQVEKPVIQSVACLCPCPHSGAIQNLCPQFWGWHCPGAQLLGTGLPRALAARSWVAPGKSLPISGYRLPACKMRESAGQPQGPTVPPDSTSGKQREREKGEVH